MSRSTHQFEIKGVDKSAGAFNSIKDRAAATAAQIRSLVGGAIAAAGAYMGFSAIKGGIDELGLLSDIAQKTSTDVGELTSACAALGALGIQNMGIEQIGKVFDYMTKTTGRAGIDGFYQTIEELGKIPDVAKRGQEAMKVFGRSGMELMPIINAADNSVEALRNVVNAMPSIPQAAAEAGDSVADAMGFASEQVKSIWLQGLGAICGWFDNEFKGGVQEASLAAGNYLEYYAKVAVSKCLTYYQKIQEYLKRFGDAWGTFAGALYGGASLRKAIDMAGEAYEEAASDYEDVAKELDQKENERTARFVRNFEDRKVAIQKFQVACNNAAASTKSRQLLEGASDGEIGRQTKVSNDLVMGGSNAATRLQVLGPTLQSESKKQTSILERIAANTEQTADNTKDQTTTDDLGVID